MVNGRIHSIETLGGLDGPSVRTVLFLQGCPLRCRYCHNPDTHDLTAGTEYSVDQVLAIVRRYRPFHGHGGGVTLSGGEPLVQRQFVTQLCQRLTAEGVHIALDTSGAIFAPEVLDLCDLVILDIKHTDPAQYQALTGGTLQPVLATLAHLQEHHREFWVRQVIVPGLNDTVEDVRALGALVRGAGRIELLAYHRMGIVKYQQLGIDYPLEGVPDMDKARLAQLQALLDHSD